MKLVIASNNKHKIKEIKALLFPHFDEIVSASEAGYCGEVEENGTTFYENAVIKAKAVSDTLNCVTLADDSGLCVDALGGAPGVYSSRYSGGGDSQNNIKLLKEMENISDRRCRFVCSVVLYYPSGKIIEGEGVCEGSLLFEGKGSGGFGYDPLFYCNELQKSFGIATEEEKNSVSHRSRALSELVKKL